MDTKLQTLLMNGEVNKEITQGPHSLDPSYSEVTVVSLSPSAFCGAHANKPKTCNFRTEHTLIIISMFTSEKF
jgi:hypothetical protein